MADRKISDLTALTAPAAGDYLPIVDISEVAAASKNKRITIEELFRGVPLGTAAAPSIAIEGDENTGIYSPGADQLAVATNGTGRLFVAANGNIGVGTASPVTQFHIQKASDGLAGIQISTSAYGSTATDGLFVGIDNDFGYLYNYENKSLIFGVNAVERMRITPAGLVGVGTSAPAASLDISPSAADTIYLSSPLAAGAVSRNIALVTTGLGKDSSIDFGYVDRVSNFASTLTFRTTLDNGNRNVARMHIDSAGRVGIGTASPTNALLHVSSPVSGASIKSEDTGGTGSFLRILGDAASQNLINWKTGTSLRFATSDDNFGSFAERFRITSTGLVGIGTSTPRGLLSISNNSVGSVVDSSLHFGFSSQDYYGFRIVNSNDPSSAAAGSLKIQRGIVSAWADAVTVNNAGNVGIGTTSPGSALEINAAAATSPFIAKINTAEAARIDSSGRLLVGTSTARGNFFNSSGQEMQFQIEGTDYKNSGASFTSNNASNAGFGPHVIFARSRGASVGSNTIVQNGDNLGIISYLGNNGVTFVDAARIICEVDGTPGATNDMPGRLVFATTADGAASPTERMRIHANGSISTNGLTSGPSASTFGTFLGRTGSPGYLESSRNVNGTLQVAVFVGTAGECFVMGDGDLENTNARYTGISDIKFKQNIEDASPQWDDIKAIQVRKYELIANPDRKHIGVIAQELEQTSPGLVIEREDANGDSYKSVAYSVLYMKAVKALQEAMERIESLEAKVAALEAQ